MTETLQERLAEKPIETSAPCRVDMGGTLDISTFYYPLHHLRPCTVNIAVGLRTHVRLLPYKAGRVKVSSRGFDSTEFSLKDVPFDHPLGLIFAIAAFFNVSGIHIEIRSSSPPRAALGGSSAAAVALVAAFESALKKKDEKALPHSDIAGTAQAIEASVAGVPCGLQDQLAAAFGGVNAWHWKTSPRGLPYKRQCIVPKSSHRRLAKHLLLAYCGSPHESRDINGRWVRQFLSGRHRAVWEDIARLTQTFAKALAHWDIKGAAAAMNAETSLRRRMTPDVLEPVGEQLVNAAVASGCGARFTGAGGGGCLWAIGEKEDIATLAGTWKSITDAHADAALLKFDIDSDGLMIKE